MTPVIEELVTSAAVKIAENKFVQQKNMLLYSVPVSATVVRENVCLSIKWEIKKISWSEHKKHFVIHDEDTQLMTKEITISSGAVEARRFSCCFQLWNREIDFLNKVDTLWNIKG